MTNWLRTTPLAHRGLHDPVKGLVENAPSSFEAAAAAGYGIELDVHLSADGEAIVFHDQTLDRMTSETGKVSDHNASDLKRLTLKGSSDTIPALQDLLDQIRGRVPLLIEIKSFHQKVGACEQRVAEILDDYSGPFAVQSFNPYSVGWFAKHAPRFPRGQLSLNYFQKDYAHLPLQGRILLHMMLLNYVSRPQFCAYEWSALPSLSAMRMRAMGRPVIAWTIKDPANLPKVLPHADNIIFEGFRPEDFGVDCPVAA